MAKVTRWKNRGFTLSETMATISIMGLVGLIIVGGFSAYIRSWRGITRQANAEIFVSTLEVKIQEELEYATAVEVDDRGNVQSFIDDGTGYTTMFVKGSADANVVPFGIHSSANPANLSSAETEALVSDSTANDMYGTYDAITYDETTHVFTITELSACRSDGRVLYQIGTIKIRNVNNAPAVKNQ